MKQNILIFLVLLACSCDKQNSSSVYDAEESVAMDNSRQDVTRGGTWKDVAYFVEFGSASDKLGKPAVQNLKLIKKGDVAFESDDLNKTAEQINNAIVKFRGYASNENETNSSHQISRSITIRVPSDNFDGLLADISKGVTRFDRRQITVSDVTEEFVDMSAQLKTKKQIEERYLQLLTKANKVTDMLEVEAKLGQIRVEIERIEGRLRYLNDQVGLSTLSINYYEIKAITSSQNPGFFSKIGNGFVKGWDMILSILIGLVTIWPIVLIAFAGVFLFRRFRRKSKS